MLATPPVAECIGRASVLSLATLPLRPDAVDDRTEVPRLVLRRTRKFLGGQNHPTIECPSTTTSRAEPFRSELDLPT
jgi:hypothetical protein